MKFGIIQAQSRSQTRQDRSVRLSSRNFTGGESWYIFMTNSAPKRKTKSKTARSKMWKAQPSSLEHLQLYFISEILAKGLSWYTVSSMCISWRFTKWHVPEVHSSSIEIDAIHSHILAEQTLPGSNALNFTHLQCLTCDKRWKFILPYHQLSSVVIPSPVVRCFFPTWQHPSRWVRRSYLTKSQNIQIIDFHETVEP